MDINYLNVVEAWLILCARLVSFEPFISLVDDTDQTCQLKLQLSQHIIGQICVGAPARITHGRGVFVILQTQNSALGPQPASPHVSPFPLWPSLLTQ